MNDTDSAAGRRRSRRGTLGYVRDVLVFQGKLLLDGVRDAVLIPASLAAGLIDVLLGRTGGDGAFERLLAWGRRSEDFINLFGRRPEAGDVDPQTGPSADLDSIVTALESQLLDPARRARLSQSARAKIEVTLEKLRRSGRE